MPVLKKSDPLPFEVSIPAEQNGSSIVENKFIITTITEAESFSGIAEEWDDLLADSPVDTIFLTSDWLSTWWQVFGHQYQMHVIIVRDSKERLVAAAPLIISETIFAFVRYRFRVLRFIGSGDDVTPEYLNLIIRQGYEIDVLKSLVDAIITSDAFDLIDFKPVSHDSFILESLVKGLAVGRFKYHFGHFSRCPILKLPSTWAEHVANSSKNFKKKSKEYLRVCQRDLNIQFRRVEHMDELQKSMNQLAELHSNRWGGKSRAFQSEGYLTFHNTLARKLLRKKMLRLNFIEQSGRPIAAFYGFKYNHRYYYYQSGRNLAFSRYHLGYVLMNYNIQEAIDEKATIFDFLTGNEHYKNHWANDFESSYRLCAYTNRNSWYFYRLMGIYKSAFNYAKFF